MRFNQQHTRTAKPHEQRSPAAPLRTKRVLMPDVESFTDPEDSVEVREITRDLCDVYAAQLADDEFR
jgi:hypothetical protein